MQIGRLGIKNFQNPLSKSQSLTDKLVAPHQAPSLKGSFFQKLFSFGGELRELELLSRLRELLDLFSRLEERLFGSEWEILKEKLTNINRAFTRREFSSHTLREILDLYLNRQDLKIRLTRLKSILAEEGRSLFSSRLQDFIDYLDRLGSLVFNTKEGFLCFVLGVHSETKRENKIVLFVNPESVKESERKDSISFGLDIETDFLGKIRILLKMLNQDIWCNAIVEDPEIREILEVQRENLESRLKNLKFTLKHFKCRLLGDFPEEDLFQGELRI